MEHPVDRHSYVNDLFVKVYLKNILLLGQCILKIFDLRGKSFLELWGTTFLPD